MPELTHLFQRAHAAVQQDTPAALRELLQSHPPLVAAINEPLGPFDAPLINSVRSPATLDVLLAHGADINARSRWWAGGFGLLDFAAPELAAHAIARGAVVDVHSAARLGQLEKLEALLAADPALVQARGGDGQTPLHFAATIEVADFLLARGAAIDARDIDHESTPAQHMVRERTAVARHLVQRGSPTDLLLASAVGDIALVREHLRRDPACIHLSVCDACFPKQNPRAGGTIYQWTLGANKTAHEVAREFGHDDIFRLLMEHSPPALQLAVACELTDEPAVTALLAAHPQISATLSDAERQKIAHAARNNRTPTVRLMLLAGWPVDACADHGATPLHWAAFHGNAAMTALLLGKNPPLEVTDRDHHATPLSWARYGQENGWHRQTGEYPATIAALLRAGARDD